MVTDLSVDLFDPAFYTGDPFPTYASLRREAPVCWHEGAGLWSVARHADVMAMSRDPRTFCSGKGVLANDRARLIAMAFAASQGDLEAFWAARRQRKAAAKPLKKDRLGKS